MTQLAELRRRLQSAGRRRRRAYLVDALCVVATAAVACGFAYYLVDRRLELTVAARAFLDAVVFLLVAWLAWTRLLPALRRREDEIDVALRIQRRRGIDADLVAALQFDRFDDRREFGSPRLVGAVVDYVAEMSPALEQDDEPLDPRLVRRRRALGAVLVVALLAVVSHPQHFAALVRRAALGDAHYPSDTQITALKINDRRPPPAADGVATFVLPQGREVAFELHAAGAVPDFATIDLRTETGAAFTVELLPTDSDKTIFRGRLAGLVESAEGRAAAGDAFGDAFRLSAAPLPRVTVTLEVRPPDYAEGVALPPPPGRLDVAVLEGSAVSVRVECANKGLRRATYTFDGRTEPLTAQDEARRIWRPAVAHWADVRRPLEFQIQVEDDDGFVLPEPLRGVISIRPDQPPTVVAEVVTKYVLPTGKPSISYHASDDLGIRSLAVARQVLRADGSTGSDRVEIPLPPDGPRTAPAGKFSLPLDGLQLAKGDRVTIRVEARDRRGDQDRAVAQSEPYTLEVTDEQGLYEAMAETDQRSARKMDEIIQKQLMLGGRTATPAPPSPSATPSAPPAAVHPAATPTAVPSAARPASTPTGTVP